ncbi:MAG: hypothetical protein JXM79_19770 [Sedimentisphaerales bacterium]|nr:hypothetical protein [Sedimentisphaerales bacterium]
MKTMFDLRSFFIGAALTVFVVFALGVSPSHSPQVDRFRFGASGSHVFVIDTATGQVWGKYVTPRQDLTSQEFMSPQLPLGKK